MVYVGEWAWGRVGMGESGHGGGLVLQKEAGHAPFPLLSFATKILIQNYN